MKLIILSIILIFLNKSYAQTAGSCIQTPVLKNFDATRYFGKWYEIERFDYIFEKNLQCVNAQYGRLNETAVSVRNYGFNTKTQKDDIVNGYAYVPNSNEPNKLLVVLPVVLSNVTIITNTGNYDVLATDYTNYALVYSCKQIIPSLLKLEIAWILSRTKTLDQQTLNNIKETAKNFKVDINKFEAVDQSCESN